MEVGIPRQHTNVTVMEEAEKQKWEISNFLQRRQKLLEVVRKKKILRIRYRKGKDLLIYRNRVNSGLAELFQQPSCFSCSLPLPTTNNLQFLLISIFYIFPKKSNVQHLKSWPGVCAIGHKGRSGPANPGYLQCELS